MMNNALSQNGDATGRPPTRKRVLPQSRPKNGDATPQYMTEQQHLITNGRNANAQSSCDNFRTNGHDREINSASKQRRSTCYCSLRDRVMFAFGFSLALAIIWCSREYSSKPEEEALMAGGGLPMNLSAKDKSVQNGSSADTNERRQFPTTSQAKSTTNDSGPKSDKVLLGPILGPSYKQFLALRRSRFEDIRTNDPEKCRHPEYYDVDYTYHNLTAGSFAQIWTDEKVRSHFKWKKKAAVIDYKKSFERTKAKYLTPTGWDEKGERWTAADVIVGSNRTRFFVNATDKSTKKSKAALKALQAKPKPRSISFLHVGKAGGSSVSCNIKASFKFGKRHCPGYEHGNKLKYAYDAHNDSAISQQVSCYVHYNERLYCYNNPTFLVNIRNPVHRLISWYLYEHRENWDVTVDHITYPNRPKHCGQQMLFACYPTLDSLATVGLAGQRPSDGEILKIGHDLGEDQCRLWAWAAVRGRVPASFHNVWNYEWYLHYLLDRKAGGKDLEIFLLRIEHLDEDWSNLDSFLGGTGSPLPKSRSHNNDASEKQLAVSDRYISAEGMKNLCRALCREIQVYKQILSIADNLSKEQVEESLRELSETCPKEINSL